MPITVLDQQGFVITQNLVYWLNQKYASSNEVLTLVIFFFGIALCAIVPYLIGSISPVIIYTQKRYHEDIRKLGIQSADPFNLYLVYGFKDALLAFLLDAADTLIAMVIGFALMAQEGAAIAMFFCFMGHVFPLFFKFKGGRGITTMILAPAFLSVPTFLILLGFFVFILLTTRFYSLAGIMYAVLLPLILRAFCNGLYFSDWYMYMSILLLVFALITQWPNINALLHGQEKHFEIGKKHIPLKKLESDKGKQKHG